jgi:hypothetical protein
MYVCTLNLTCFILCLFQYISLGVFVDSLFLLGNIYHLWRSPTLWNSTTVRNTWINKLLMIDAFINFILAAFPFALTDVMFAAIVNIYIFI